MGDRLLKTMMLAGAGAGAAACAPGDGQTIRRPPPSAVKPDGKVGQLMTFDAASGRYHVSAAGLKAAGFPWAVKVGDRTIGLLRTPADRLNITPVDDVSPPITIEPNADLVALRDDHCIEWEYQCSGITVCKQVVRVEEVCNVTPDGSECHTETYYDYDCEWKEVCSDVCVEWFTCA
jgi:hypothetical protein